MAFHLVEVGSVATGVDICVRINQSPMSLAPAWSLLVTRGYGRHSLEARLLRPCTRILAALDWRSNRGRVGTRPTPNVIDAIAYRRLLRMRFQGPVRWLRGLWNLFVSLVSFTFPPQPGYPLQHWMCERASRDGQIGSAPGIVYLPFRGSVRLLVFPIMLSA